MFYFPVSVLSSPVTVTTSFPSRAATTRFPSACPIAARRQAASAHRFAADGGFRARRRKTRAPAAPLPPPHRARSKAQAVHACPRAELFQLPAGNLRQLRQTQPRKAGDTVDSSEKLGTEQLPQRKSKPFRCLLRQKPSPPLRSSPLPAFEVMTTIAFLNRDGPSHRVGQHAIVHDLQRRFRTSRCAFSTSSSKTTQYGRRRTFSVSVPASSCPT